MSILMETLLHGLKKENENTSSNVQGERRESSVDDMVLEATYGYDGIPTKDAKAIQEDFRMCKHELAHCSAMVESLANAPENTKSEKLFKQRQRNAIAKKRSNKIEHLKRLNARLKALHEHHNKEFNPLRSQVASPSRAIPSITNSAPFLSPSHKPNHTSGPGTVDITDSSTGKMNRHHKQALMIATPSTSSGDVPDESESKKSSFHVDRSRIQALEDQQQDAELRQLGLTVYNQDEFEQGVLDQVDEALAADEEIRRNKVMQKEMTAIQEDVKSCQQEVEHCDKVMETMGPLKNMSKETRRRLEAVSRQRLNKVQNLKRLEGRQKALYQRMLKSLNQMEGGASTSTSSSSAIRVDSSQSRVTGTTNGAETEEERMIRLGEMTPFGTVMRNQEARTSQTTNFEKYLLDQNEKSQGKPKSKHKRRRSSLSSMTSERTTSSTVVKREDPLESPGMTLNVSRIGADGNFFDAKDKKVYRPAERDFSNYTPRKRKLHTGLEHHFSEDGPGMHFQIGDEVDEDDYDNQFADSTYVPPHEQQFENDSEEEYDTTEPSAKKRRKKDSKGSKKTHNDTVDLGELKARYGVKKKSSSGGSGTRCARAKDDGSHDFYSMRIREWRRQRAIERNARLETGEPDSSDESDMEFDSGFRVPATIWKKLYRYQKTCVKWLWELHQQQCGGIIGDEMGLGKTIQVISFLVALKHSQLRDRASSSRYTGLGPVLIVCPITVLHQWVSEFHKWWPQFRVAVLHSSGSHTGSERELVRDIVAENGVLMTSYSHVVIHQDLLLRYDWHYLVLDEGHKIRNPDAQATIAVKQFRTCHRLILSGSPLQNNLKELWSLVDFVFPGKLGTLPDFMAHFSVPITAGGYSNATQVQVTTAYKCACILRDTINPYLLRRMKADVRVSLDLPQKNEQVLFCRLTPHQRDVYQEYLDSKECHQILSGNYMVFPGLITLRKVCNHPDLSTGGPDVFDRHSLEQMTPEERQHGHFSRSGKLMVVESLLRIWQKQGHRVLLFTQGTQMMDILERFVRSRGYTYLRMDGQTSIGSRQPLIKRFNEDASLFVFLLTTRVGGLGVNLTGADRVVIFDPDWNPSTDLQARERAWRIGQTRQVTIYRLITTGTIEEKIYHRQIFKQFLTNRVLKDPKQRRFFKSNDLYELFTLGNDDLEVGTETSAIFAGTGSDVKVKLDVKEQSEGKQEERKKKRKNMFDAIKEKKKDKEEEEDPDIDMSGNDEMDLDKEKLKRMKEMAKRLSQQLFASKSSTPTIAGAQSKNSQSEDSNSNDATKQIVAASDDAIKATPDQSHLTEAANKPSDQTCDITQTNPAAQQTVSDSCDNSNSKGDQPKPTSNTNPNSDSTSAKTVSKEGDRSKVDAEKERRQRRKERERKEKEKKDRDRKNRKKEKEKRKRKSKNAKFEGERVSHLAGQSTYKPPEEDDTPSNDDFVLQTLFKKSGVHSAMQHDTIMQSSSADYALVEGEAERVAREAARALRASRHACYSATSGRPTWTGQSGTSKPRFGQKKNTSLQSLGAQQKEKKEKEDKKKAKSKPMDLPLFAPDPVSHHFDGSLAGNVKQSTSLASKSTQALMSSADLLNKMRARNFSTVQPEPEVNGDEDDDPFSLVTVEADPEYMELITDIRNFIAFGARVDGQANTQEILDQFKERIPSQDTAKFKAMLKQLCDLNKDGSTGTWRLKLEYR